MVIRPQYSHCLLPACPLSACAALLCCRERSVQHPIQTPPAVCQNDQTDCFMHTCSGPAAKSAQALLAASCCDTYSDRSAASASLFAMYVMCPMYPAEA
jgi:hypothetical protein